VRRTVRWRLLRSPPRRPACRKPSARRVLRQRQRHRLYRRLAGRVKQQVNQGIWRLKADVSWSSVKNLAIFWPIHGRLRLALAYDADSEFRLLSRYLGLSMSRWAGPISRSATPALALHRSRPNGSPAAGSLRRGGTCVDRYTVLFVPHTAQPLCCSEAYLRNSRIAATDRLLSLSFYSSEPPKILFLSLSPRSASFFKIRIMS
jgi:hypothetical protein